MKILFLSMFALTACATAPEYQRNDNSSRSKLYSTSATHCFQGVLEELYTTGFLQGRIDDLSDNGNCWPGTGLPKLRDSLESNITSSLRTSITLPTCPIVIKSGSNNFWLSLENGIYRLNGFPGSLLVPLVLVHLACMTLAFFIVYPIILILASAAALCSPVQKPMHRHKMLRWQSILQLIIFFPLVAIGFVAGICAKGRGTHFQTEHEVTGLTTTVLASLAVIIHFAERQLNGHEEFRASILKTLRYADFAVCQSILLISSFTLPSGVDDLRVVTLCKTGRMSTSLAFSLGMTVTFIWNSAMMVMTIEWWLSRRVNAGEGGRLRLERLTNMFRRET